MSRGRRGGVDPSAPPRPQGLRMGIIPWGGCLRAINEEPVPLGCHQLESQCPVGRATSWGPGGDQRGEGRTGSPLGNLAPHLGLPVDRADKPAPPHPLPPGSLFRGADWWQLSPGQPTPSLGTGRSGEWLEQPPQPRPWPPAQVQLHLRGEDPEGAEGAPAPASHQQSQRAEGERPHVAPGAKEEGAAGPDSGSACRRWWG